jgi:hypothetical protein
MRRILVPRLRKCYGGCEIYFAAVVRGRGAYVLLKLLREFETVNVPSGCTETLM